MKKDSNEYRQRNREKNKQKETFNKYITVCRIPHNMSCICFDRKMAHIRDSSFNISCGLCVYKVGKYLSDTDGIFR